MGFAFRPLAKAYMTSTVHSLAAGLQLAIPHRIYSRPRYLFATRYLSTRELIAIIGGSSNIAFAPDLVRASSGSLEECSRLPNREFRMFEYSRPCVGARAIWAAMNMDLGRNLTGPRINFFLKKTQFPDTHSNMLTQLLNRLVYCMCVLLF
jgi:hypothetical protein